MSQEELYEEIEAIAEQVNVMKERIRELEEMLDPLMIRSLILSTQCNLCPA